MTAVILVDEEDRVLGQAEKMAVHRPPGLLHRALSVFLYDVERRLLLQRRATTKHHFQGMWANSCCSHPNPGEDVVVAGRRRLREEMGVEAELTRRGSFRYRAIDPHTGLVEHEVDHVLVGFYDGGVEPNPAEVDDWSWTDVDRVRDRVFAGDNTFAPWVRAAFEALPALSRPTLPST